MSILHSIAIAAVAAMAIAGVFLLLSSTIGCLRYGESDKTLGDLLAGLALAAASSAAITLWEIVRLLN